MPFASKRQQRAAFAGAIPGFSKSKAREWAEETDFSDLPESAKSAKLKPLASKLRGAARRLSHPVRQPGTVKNVADAHDEQRERHERSKKALVEFCTKLAFSLPKPPAVGRTLSEISASKAGQTGLFKGVATPSTLKPPGPAASRIPMNPRRSVRQAMNAYTA